MTCNVWAFGNDLTKFVSFLELQSFKIDSQNLLDELTFLNSIISSGTSCIELKGSIAELYKSFVKNGCKELNLDLFVKIDDKLNSQKLCSEVETVEKPDYSSKKYVKITQSSTPSVYAEDSGRGVLG